MGDDAATVEQLRAELRQYHDLYEAARAEIATLREKDERRDRALSEALAQQTALAEVLRVIASTQTDPIQVLTAIATSAAQLLGTGGVNIWLVEGSSRPVSSRAESHTGVV